MGFSRIEIESLFKKYSDFSDFENFSLYLVRRDGLVLYSSSGEDISSIQSAGALLSGLWQASEALSNFIPNNSGKDQFRLCFDSSSNGVYTIPFSVLEKDFFLTIIYHDVLNPGPLKIKLRSLKNYLIGNSDFFIERNSKEKTLLFNNITDEEMDHIFANYRN